MSQLAPNAVKRMKTTTLTPLQSFITEEIQSLYRQLNGRKLLAFEMGKDFDSSYEFSQEYYDERKAMWEKFPPQNPGEISNEIDNLVHTFLKKEYFKEQKFDLMYSEVEWKVFEVTDKKTMDYIAKELSLDRVMELFSIQTAYQSVESFLLYWKLVEISKLRYLYIVETMKYRSVEHFSKLYPSHGMSFIMKQNGENLGVVLQIQTQDGTLFYHINSCKR